MANANYQPTVSGTTLTGTSADDTISVDPSAASGGVTINAGNGNDTIIFDGVLGAGTVPTPGLFIATGANNFNYNNNTAVFTVGGYETLTFDNGTVTSAASVTAEQILADSISATIADLGEDATGTVGGDGVADFDLSTVLNWDGSFATVDGAIGDYTILSIEGQSSIAGANITIIEDGVVQGRAEVLAGNAGIDVTAENGFHSSITEIGATEAMEIDVVLTNGTDTFEETLTVNVTGVATAADNTFAGTAGVDTIDGLGGDDVLRGGADDDVIFGNTGNDQIWAGADDGVGTTLGSTGADFFIGGNGDDIIGGGVGNDVLVGNAHIVDSTALGFPVAGSDFGAVTDDGSNTLYGGDGNDVIAVGGYDATVSGNGALTAGTAATAVAADFTGTIGGVAWGGAGNDTIFGTASGDDVLGGGDGDDTINTLDGVNTVYAGAGNDTINGGAGNSTIYGGDGVDAITGGTGDEVIFNGAGDDVAVNGGAGDDTLWGGAGDDTLTGGAGADVFAFAVGNGADTITDFTDGTDMIDLSDLGITSLNELVTEDQGLGNGFVIFYGEADSITLTGFGGLGTITDADFIFA